MQLAAELTQLFTLVTEEVDLHTSGLADHLESESTSHALRQ